MSTKISRTVMACVSLAGLLIGSNAAAGDPFLAGHPLFKPLAGDWEGSGELKGQDGNTLSVKESWTGKFEENGNFIAKGTREFGDETHTFEWEYLHNPTTELIEGIMRLSTSEDEVRFEVNLSEQHKTITLKSQLSGDGASLEIVNTIEAGKVTGTVKLTNADGIVSLAGKIVHTRKKAE